MTNQQGWKLHIPALGNRPERKLSALGTQEQVIALLDKSLHNVARKHGVWTPMTADEVAAKNAEMKQKVREYFV